MKGKQANVVGSQYSSTLPRNMVYPALLPTIKTYDKLPSSIVSRELSSKSRQFQLTVDSDLSSLSSSSSSSSSALIMILSMTQKVASLFTRTVCKLDRSQKGTNLGGNFIPQSEEPLTLSLSRAAVFMGKGIAFSRTWRCLSSQNGLVLGKFCPNLLAMTLYTRQVLLCVLLSKAE